MRWLHPSLPIALLVLAASPAGAAERETHIVGLANRTGATIREVYIAPADGSGWGPNRLVSRLPDGARGDFRYTGPCEAKLRMVLEGGGAEERRDVSICDHPSLVVSRDWQTADLAAPVPVTRSAEEAARPAPAASRPPPAQRIALPDPPVPEGPVVRSLTKRYGGL